MPKKERLALAAARAGVAGDPAPRALRGRGGQWSCAWPTSRCSGGLEPLLLVWAALWCVGLAYPRRATAPLLVAPYLPSLCTRAEGTVSAPAWWRLYHIFPSSGDPSSVSYTKAFMLAVWSTVNDHPELVTDRISGIGDTSGFSVTHKTMGNFVGEALRSTAAPRRTSWSRGTCLWSPPTATRPTSVCVRSGRGARATGHRIRRVAFRVLGQGRGANEPNRLQARGSPRRRTATAIISPPATTAPS